MATPTEAINRLGLYNTSTEDVPYTFVGPTAFGYVSTLPMSLQDISTVSAWIATVADSYADSLEETLEAANNAMNAAAAAEASKNAAAGSATAASGSATAAETSATAAATSAGEALTSRNEAVTAKNQAQTIADSVTDSVSEAADSATAAAASATTAVNARNAAVTAAEAAEDSLNSIGTAVTDAQSAATAASGSATAAAGSASDALASKNAATTSATNASDSATAAAGSATAASGSASAAATSADTAEGHKNAAAASAASAATDAQTATDAITTVNTAVTDAINAKDAALGYRDAAQDAADAALSSQTAAAGSASTAQYWAEQAQGAVEGNAAAIDFTPSGNIAATNVQTAIEELDAEKATSAQGAKADTALQPEDIGTGPGDLVVLGADSKIPAEFLPPPVDLQASAVEFTPAAPLTATNVQDAIEEAVALGGGIDEEDLAEIFEFSKVLDAAILSNSTVQPTIEGLIDTYTTYNFEGTDYEYYDDIPVIVTPSGTSVYVIRYSNGVATEKLLTVYTLSTPFDVTTATVAANYIFESVEEGEIFHYEPSTDKLYGLIYNSDDFTLTLKTYTVSAPNLTFVSNVMTTDANFPVPELSAFYLDPDFKNIIICGEYDDVTLEILRNLMVAFRIDPATMEILYQTGTINLTDQVPSFYPIKSIQSTFYANYGFSAFRSFAIFDGYGYIKFNSQMYMYSPGVFYYNLNTSIKTGGSAVYTFSLNPNISKMCLAYDYKHLVVKTASTTGYKLIPYIINVEEITPSALASVNDRLTRFISTEPYITNDQLFSKLEVIYLESAEGDVYLNTVARVEPGANITLKSYFSPQNPDKDYGLRPIHLSIQSGVEDNPVTINFDGDSFDGSTDPATVAVPGPLTFYYRFGNWSLI